MSIDFWLKELFNDKIKPLIWWAKDEKWKTGILIVGIILVSSFGRLIYEFLSPQAISSLFRFIIAAIRNNTQISINCGLLLLVIVSYILIFWSNIKGKIININFKRGLDDWSIEVGSKWALIPGKREEVFGPVLKAAGSHSPGIYKCGTQWINYRLKFRTKIIRSNFSFVIRAKDRDNCIFIQCGIEADAVKIYPHYVVNGIYVRNRNNTQIGLSLTQNDWHEIEACVVGNNVEIKIGRGVAHIDISPVRLFVYTNQLRGVMEWKDLIQMDEKIRLVLGAGELFGQSIDSLYFGFDSGAVGFRECGDEEAHFRKISVELIE